MRPLTLSPLLLWTSDFTASSSKQAADTKLIKHWSQKIASVFQTRWKHFGLHWEGPTSSSHPFDVKGCQRHLFLGRPHLSGDIRRHVTSYLHLQVYWATPWNCSTGCGTCPLSSIDLFPKSIVLPQSGQPRRHCTSAQIPPPHAFRWPETACNARRLYVSVLDLVFVHQEIHVTNKGGQPSTKYATSYKARPWNTFGVGYTTIVGLCERHFVKQLHIALGTIQCSCLRGDCIGHCWRQRKHSNYIIQNICFKIFQK